ncbi:MAG: hypothetical protein ACK47B_20355 [Armatimonadota bacterium]
MSDLPPPEELTDCAPWWTSERQNHVLVRVVLPDESEYLDIYHRDGTYLTPPDARLCALVLERMLAAGVPVLDGDAWVLQQKLAPYKYLWTGRADRFLVIRFQPPDGSPRNLIYDEEGEVYPIYEDPVRDAVVERMLAASVELIEIPDLDAISPQLNVKQEAELNLQVEEETAEVDGTLYLRLFEKPPFEPASSWRIVGRRSPGEITAYFAQYVSWTYGTELSFRERVRLPVEEQGWTASLVQDEVPLDGAWAESLLLELQKIRIPAYVPELGGGKDGTTYRLTLGHWPHQSEWTWWCSGPEEWLPLVELAFEAREYLEQLFNE